MKPKQIAIITSLLCVAMALLYRSFTYSEEVRMVKPDAIFSGEVQYKGKPVPYALVILSGKGYSATGVADDEGKVVIPNAPTGPVKIGVNTDAGRGMMQGVMMSNAHSGKGKKSNPVFVDLPKKFHAPETSGLEVEIADGKKTTEKKIDL